MNYVEYLEENVKSGAEAFWRAVKAIPEDKLDWKPSPDSRTARQLITEVATITGATADMIKGRSVEASGGGGGESKDAKSLDELEKIHQAGLEKYFAVIQGFPEAELADGLDLPWGHMTYLQMIDYVYWNMMYHYGQISYIQTLYGDTNYY